MPIVLRGTLFRIIILPDELKGAIFYDPGKNPKEEEIRKRLNSLWKDIYDYDK